jgi:arabinose-5-phosphate isomerase
VSEIMLKNKHIPIVDENLKMKDAIKTLSQKKLGFILVVNKNNINTGIFTDGDLKRLFKKLGSGFYNLEIKKFMKTKPYNVEENTLATDVLKHMNKRKITGAGVYNKFNKKKIIGVIHIHHLLKALS